MRSRSIPVWMRLNEKEAAHLQRLVATSGLKREVFLRKLLMGYDIKPRPPAEWPELLRQVSAIGNNINQIARIANSEKAISHDALQEAMRLQAAIWEKVKNI